MDSPGFCDRANSSVMAINITTSRIMFLVAFGKKTPTEETCPFENNCKRECRRSDTESCGYLYNAAALLVIVFGLNEYVEYTA